MFQSAHVSESHFLENRPESSGPNCSALAGRSWPLEAIAPLKLLKAKARYKRKPLQWSLSAVDSWYKASGCGYVERQLIDCIMHQAEIGYDKKLCKPCFFFRPVHT